MKRFLTALIIFLVPCISIAGIIAGTGQFTVVAAKNSETCTPIATWNTATAVSDESGWDKSPAASTDVLISADGGISGTKCPYVDGSVTDNLGGVTFDYGTGTWIETNVSRCITVQGSIKLSDASFGDASQAYDFIKLYDGSQFMGEVYIYSDAVDGSTIDRLRIYWRADAGYQNSFNYGGYIDIDPVLSDATFYKFKAKWVWSSTDNTGEVYLWLDDTLMFSKTDIDNNSVTPSLDWIAFGPLNGTNSNVIDTYIDNVQVCSCD